MSQDVPNEQLVAVLSSASSHVQNERDAAVSFLEQHQQQQGFQYELVKVVAVKSLPVNVRTQAILFFKNGLDKYWRKGTPKWAKTTKLAIHEAHDFSTAPWIQQISS